MSEEMLRELLSTTVPNFDNEMLSDILNEWAPHLPLELLSQAETLTHAMYNDDYRALAVVGLAPYLPEREALQEVLDGALRIGNEWIRARALANLVPHLPNGIKGEAIQECLQAVLATQREDLREDGLQAVAPLLPGWANADPRSGYSGWKETLRTLSDLPRPIFLRYLERLLPFGMALAQEGERETVAEHLFHAIKEVGDWP
jgi:hypothetical protein